MADFFDPYSKPRMKVSKGTSWGNWNLPDGMTDSEAVNRRERFRKMNRRIKSQHLEQKSRLPFEEMFLFGSHPENDILSISQCPGCGRRYKTQWLHNFHWEANASGDFVCACSKKVVIPHRSSSKSDHHKHHHQDSSKVVDGVHHSSYSHSKQSNRSSSPKVHQSSKSNLAKIDSKSSKQLKKPALITKAKAKMMPPPAAAPPVSVSKSANISSKSRSKTPTASYTLSIPSEDTGQNESVESLLQSSQSKSYSNGSNYGNKPIHMIATAVQKASKVALEGEYEQLKFYSDPSSYEKKNKSSSGHSHSHGVGHSSHGHSSGHSHSHSHGHGHGHAHSHKSSSNDLDKQAATTEGVTLMSGDSGSVNKTSHSSKNVASGASGPVLQNFKIPLKSKSHVGSTPPPTASVAVAPVNSSRSNSSHTSSHSSKHKSKLPPTPKPPHPDNHHSSPRSTPPSSSSPGPVSQQHLSSPAQPASNGQLAQTSGPSQASLHTSHRSGGVTPSYKSPVHPSPVESPVLVEVKNEELSPPPKKKKKKKSKDEPRKILPLKDRLFDPDIHCGVCNGDSGIPCTRSLTCKTHSMALRRAVPGRSQNFDQLLAEHKKARDAEKAAKVAFDQQQSDTSNVSSPSSIIMQANSPGTSKQSKVKSKNSYTVSIPSPLSNLPSPNAVSRSASSPGPANSYPNSGNASAQTKAQPYSSQTMQSSSSSVYVPKLEILSEKSSVNRNAVSTDSSGTSSNNKNSYENIRSPSVSRDSKGFYDMDDLAAGCKVTGFSKPGFSATKSSVSSPVLNSVEHFSASTLAVQSPGTKTPDYVYNVEIPMEVQTEAYLSSNVGKPVEGRGMSGEPMIMQDSYQQDDMEIQDPLSAALEMAASAAAMGSGAGMHDISHGFSSPVGLMSGNIDHTSLIGLPSSVSQHLYPATASSVYCSPTTGYNSGFNIRNPAHAMTSSVFTPAVSQNYSMSASTYSNTYAASGTDFQAESFHADANEYQKEAVYQAAAGFQPSNFSSSFTSYSSAALYQSVPLARYPVASVYPKTPSVFPTTSVYPTSSYSSTTPAVYPPTPLYQAAASSLFPAEPPLFSIIDDLFSETPAPSVSANGAYPDIAHHDPTSSNSTSSFHQQPFPSVSRIPASAPGMPPSLAPSMDMNSSLGRQWGSSSTGTHYSPFSGGTGSSVLVTHLEGDIDNPEVTGPCNTAGLALGPTKLEIQNRKKLLLAKEKLNQCENSPGDYLTLLAEGENIERGFMVVQSRKPSDENRYDSNVENGKKSEKSEGDETKDKVITNSVLKQKRIWKKLKQTHFPTIVPFESKRATEDASSKKNKTKKKCKKSQPTLTSVPYILLPDPSISEEVANRIAETSVEAMRALQTSAKAIAAYADTANGSNKRRLSTFEMELPRKSKKHCMYKILSDLNKDFDVDLFNGMKGLRTKNFLRLIKFDSSLHGDKKERKNNLHAQRRKEMPMNFLPKDVENAVVSDEIETHIDTVPAIEVDPQN